MKKSMMRRTVLSASLSGLMLFVITGQTMAAAPVFDYANSTSGLTTVVIPKNAQKKMDAEPVLSRHSNDIVGGYVSEWSQYDRKFDLETLEPTAYNHLVYSFLGICGDKGSKAGVVAKACTELGLKEFQIVPLDLYAGFQSAISDRQKKQNWISAYDGVSPENYKALNLGNTRGLMGQLHWMKQQNKDLKISVSIGGWTLSEPFHRMAANPESRAIFINSVNDFVKKWQLDGVDVDWEFPGHGGESGITSGAIDGDNFVLLVNELKSVLAKNIKISSAVGATKQYIDLVGAKNYVKLGEALDNIYLMNYDYWGAWSTNLGHHSNLVVPEGSPDGANSAVNAIKLLAEAGVPKHKIVLGVANYSRGKQGTISDMNDPSSATGVTATQVFGTYEATVLEGYDLFGNLVDADLKGKNGFNLYTDPGYNADYFYNAKSKVYFSIDTPRTAYMKAKYAKDNGLGGVFVWTVEQDYLGHTVNALNEGQGHSIDSIYTDKERREAIYKTCGVNLSKDQCEQLLNGESPDPEEENEVPLAPEAIVGSDLNLISTSDNSRTYKLDGSQSKNAATYQWKSMPGNPFPVRKGNSAIAEFVVPRSTAISSTGHFYELTVTGKDGKQSTARIKINVAHPSMTVTGPKSIDQGQKMYLTAETNFAQATSGSALTYRWNVRNFNGGKEVLQATGQQLDLSTLAAGKYIAVAHASSPDGSRSASKQSREFEIKSKSYAEPKVTISGPTSFKQGTGSLTAKVNQTNADGSAPIYKWMVFNSRYNVALSGSLEQLDLSTLPVGKYSIGVKATFSDRKWAITPSHIVNIVPK